MGKNESGVKWIVGLTGGLAAVASYLLVVRPWMLSWGASKDEVNHLLPGDEFIPEPRLNATHAVDIQAPPAAVWPWLVQIGQGRGGFYSYEWIENSMGLDMHNANRILPEFQNLKAGDTIPLAPDGFGVPVAILEANRTLVLHGDTRLPGPGKLPPMKPGEYLAVSWGFYLFERENRVTRLVERWKADWSPGFASSIFYRLFLEPGAFIMERKMLLGIKHRVEATVSSI
jgi:hypothetical protein